MEEKNIKSTKYSEILWRTLGLGKQVFSLFMYHSEIGDLPFISNQHTFY